MRGGGFEEDRPGFAQELKAGRAVGVGEEDDPGFTLLVAQVKAREAAGQDQKGDTLDGVGVAEAQFGGAVGAGLDGDPGLAGRVVEFQAGPAPGEERIPTSAFCVSSSSRRPGVPPGPTLIWSRTRPSASRKKRRGEPSSPSARRALSLPPRSRTTNCSASTTDCRARPLRLGRPGRGEQAREHQGRRPQALQSAVRPLKLSDPPRRSKRTGSIPRVDESFIAIFPQRSSGAGRPSGVRPGRDTLTHGTGGRHGQNDSSDPRGGRQSGTARPESSGKREEPARPEPMRGVIGSGDWKGRRGRVDRAGVRRRPGRVD